MKPVPTLTAAATTLVLAITPALAQTTVTLDFEGAAGYVNAIAEFYNGGTDSLGQSGPNLGISFTNAAVALSNDVLGPYYSNAPSPLTVMFAFDTTAVMNVAAGFIDRLTFSYASNANTLDAVNIYSGLNATGTLLASASLFGNASLACTDSPYCRFDLTSVKFAGLGQSISFGGNAPGVLYDNVTVTTVPEPSTYLMLALGLLAVVVAKRGRAD